jgi:hypothetical protein
MEAGFGLLRADEFQQQFAFAGRRLGRGEREDGAFLRPAL